MSRGLIIAGHGSAKNLNARKPICHLVQALRERNLFDEVRCALWKEAPYFSQILDRMSAIEITVVPFFMSEGYYSETVIPREMGLDGPVTRLADGRTIRLTPPVGLDPMIAELIEQRAREAGADGSECLAVLGHGTERNPKSQENIFRQAERVRARGQFAEVLTVFIDQSPHYLELWEMTGMERVVVVPLFAADGWHVSETIPAEIQEAGLDVIAGRQLVLARAVGTDPALIQVVLKLTGVENALD